MRENLLQAPPPSPLGSTIESTVLTPALLCSAMDQQLQIAAPSRQGLRPKNQQSRLGPDPTPSLAVAGTCDALCGLANRFAAAAERAIARHELAAVDFPISSKAGPTFGRQNQRAKSPLCNNPAKQAWTSAERIGPRSRPVRRTVQDLRRRLPDEASEPAQALVRRDPGNDGNAPGFQRRPRARGSNPPATKIPIPA